MTFRRTVSGLSNFYLFVGADAVVFLEGGLSISRDDVDNEEYTSSSSDIRFWQTLFSIYRPEVNYQFRSVGSKETVKSIALDIKAGRIKNVVAAMDRDFDAINNRLIQSDNILYTRGYSWENDAWNSAAILEAFCTLSGACKNDVADESKVLNQLLSMFSTQLSRVVRIDAILSQYENSLFDREKPKRYVTIEKNGSPGLNAAQIKISLADARKKVTIPIFRKTNFKTDGYLDCFGHLFAEYAYRILAYLVEKMRKLPKIPKEYATGMVVEKFGQLLSMGFLPGVKQHYDIQFAGISP